MTRETDRYAQKRAQRERERAERLAAWQRLVALAEGKYSPDQPRATNGQFGEGDGGGVSPQAHAFEKLSTVKKAAILTRAQAAWRDGLTSQQKNALMSYARDVSINRVLRGTGRLAAGDESAAVKAIPRIDHALASSALPQDMVLHRGVAGDWAEQLWTAASGSSSAQRTFTDPGYTSTSLDTTDTAHFSWGTDGLVADIYAQKGQPGAYVEPLTDAGEHEVLLPRNSGYTILGSSTEQGGQRRISLQYLGPASTATKAQPVAVPGQAPPGSSTDRFTWHDGDVIWETDKDQQEGDAGRMARPGGRASLPSSSSFQKHLADRLVRRRGD